LVCALGLSYKRIAWFFRRFGDVIGLLSQNQNRPEAGSTLSSKGQEIGKIGTWALDIKKNELLWTDETYKILGLPAGTKLTYETFLKCLYPDDREYVDSQLRACLDKRP
jgi:hypothetical protein